MDRASGETERDLLLAARNGDQEAGTLLVRRYGASMIRAARSVSGCWSGTDVEDWVQEAFIAALTTPALPRGDVGAWLRSIAVRKTLDGCRRTVRRAESSLDTSVESNEFAGPRRTETSLDVLALREALARLSALDRAVLTLVDLEGFSMAEAARAVGSSTVAVKWRAVRARRRLRALLETPAGSKE